MLKRFHYIFYILLVLSTICCFNPEDYDPRISSTQAEFIPSDTAVIADGSTAAKIKFKIINNHPNEILKVVFRTSAGTFKGGQGDSISVSLEKDFTARANLIHTKSGNAIITAKIKSVVFSNTAKVDFIKAFPNKISVSVDSLSIRNNFKSEVLVTANIKAESGGIATEGHSVEFMVYDESNAPLGFFQNQQNFAKSDSKGNAFVRYSAGESSYKGLLKIIARTMQEDGSLISDTTFLNLTN